VSEFISKKFYRIDFWTDYLPGDSEERIRIPLDPVANVIKLFFIVSGLEGE
jgi:hypothetical protein